MGPLVAGPVESASLTDSLAINAVIYSELSMAFERKCGKRVGEFRVKCSRYSSRVCARIADCGGILGEHEALSEPACKRAIVGQNFPDRLRGRHTVALRWCLHLPSATIRGH